MKHIPFVAMASVVLLHSAAAKEATSSFYADSAEIEAADFETDPNDTPLFSSKMDNVEARVIGRGYDTVVGEMKPSRCVFMEKSTLPLGDPGNSPDVHFALTKIDDENTFSTASELTASAAFSWASGSADASAKYLSEGKFSFYKSYMMQGVDITYPEQTQDYEKFHLTQYSKSLLGKEGGLELFRFHCGDAFVIGFNRGAKFSAMMAADAATTTEQSADKQAISAAYNQGLNDGKIKGEAKSFLERKQTSSQLHIEVVRSALSENLPAMDLPTLTNYALAFPEKIANLNPKPIRKIVTAPYSTLLIKEGLSSLGPTPPWAKALSNGFIYLRSLERYKADLQYIRDNRAEFVSFDSRPLAARIDHVGNVITGVIAWAAECRRTQGKNCVGLEPARLGVPPFSALRAEPWLDPRKQLFPQISTPQPVGDTPDTTDMVLESKGMWRFGRYPSQVGPMTFSTRVKIVNKTTGKIDWLPTQISMVVPANSSVFFQFIDKPDSYGDNDVYWDNPGSVRLGGRIDEFIIETSLLTLE